MPGKQLLVFLPCILLYFAVLLVLLPQILEQEEATDIIWCKLLHLET